MSIREGDYVTIRARDSKAERANAAEQMMMANGCRSVRFAVLPDGRLQVHGYVRQQECAKCCQPAQRLEGAWCEACNDHQGG